MTDTQVAKLGGILASELKLHRTKDNRFSVGGGVKTNEGLCRFIVDILNKNGIKCEIPDEDTKQSPDIREISGAIFHEERGFLMAFGNKHIAKEAMNEILHAFDEAGHDKSNLVGDVLNGIGNQLDEAFGNPDWDDGEG